MIFSKSMLASLKVSGRKLQPPANVDCVQKLWVPDKLLYSTKTAEGYQAINAKSGKTGTLWVARYPLAPISREAAQFIQHVQRLYALPCRIAPLESYGIDRNGTAFIVTRPQSVRPVAVVALRPAELLQTVKQIFGIMAELHRAGIVLGDISEHTFALDSSGEVFLSAPHCSFETLEKVAIATLAAEHRCYLPPEQVQSGEKSTAADVFSLGALVYQLLTRRHFPIVEDFEQYRFFRDKYFEAILHGVISSAPWAEAVITKALDYDPQLRYQDAGEMLAAVAGQEADGDQPAADEDRRGLWSFLTASGADPLDLFRTPGAIVGLSCLVLLIFIGRANMGWSGLNEIDPDKSVMNVLASNDIDVSTLEPRGNPWAEAMRKDSGGEDDLSAKLTFGRRSSLAGEGDIEGMSLPASSGAAGESHSAAGGQKTIAATRTTAQPKPAKWTSGQDVLRARRLAAAKVSSGPSVAVEVASAAPPAPAANARRATVIDMRSKSLISLPDIGHLRAESIPLPTITQSLISAASYQASVERLFPELDSPATRSCES